MIVPMVVCLELATTRTAPSVARLHARKVLSAWQVAPADIETVELVVSELVTNAARHASPTHNRPTYVELAGVERLTLTLRFVPAGIVVEVFDRDPSAPRLVRPQPLDEHGRGLSIVARLSARCGAAPVHEDGSVVGKIVWSLVKRGRGLRRQPSMPQPPRAAPPPGREQLRAAATGVPA